MTAPPRALSLGDVLQGKQTRLLRAMWFGPPGIGKTEMASHLPRPIFLSLDDGARHVDAAKVPKEKIRTFDDVRAWIRFLRDEQHDFQTLVIDVIDEVEAMIRAEAVSEAKPWAGEKGARITSYAKVPYGHAHKHVIDAYWRPLLADLEALQRKRSMHVCLLSWAAEGRTGDDMGQSMTMWMPRLQDAPGVSAMAVIFGWCEDVLFFAWERLSAVGDDDSWDRRRKDAKQVGRGRRVIRTQGDGPWWAKNRHGMPPEMDMTWEVLSATMPDLMFDPPAKVRERIQCALVGADEALRKQTEDLITRAGDDVGLLYKAEQWLANRRTA